MLEDKALENLAAGELLLVRGFPNAAASRLHYAMYQAAVYRLNRLGHRPERFRSGAEEWDHSMVLNNLFRAGGLPAERGLYSVMRQQRGVADYGEAAAVSAAELESRRDRIHAFVRRLAL